ncbi:M24 family metallopeptidase [Chelatococcus asaccharovorans]|uniref:M24 family metallopeptidase n=1 Tax=Chelatococcus asaccharovorans TaxID=28210 RepID=UPI00224C6B55|nr:Xaa-Pro peptidase family protein [Chelatococcus asaccharovorans]CAH1649118.1 Xaa-Pro dipeptidase [Chelatococcus asaccharovorans]CAH1691340.1 Xaa-Pro dipeptidase [Chelatococcus asaccharovorans]
MSTPKVFAFPLEEYAGRVAVLRERMRDVGADVLIIDEFEHLAYFTGHIPTAAMYQCCLMPAAGEPVMIVRSLDGPMLEEMSWTKDHILFDDGDDPIAIVIAELKRRGFGKSRIAVETDSHILLPKRLKAFKAGLDEARFIDFGGHMWEQRLRKSPREIDYLRRCAGICDVATLAGAEASRAGVPEREVAAAITSAALKAGADNTRLLLMQSGPRSSTLHGGLGNRILANGDIVHIEMVPHLRGYTARSMRPVSVGAPSARQREAAQALISLQDAQFQAMRPGAHAGEVDAILREGVLKAGLRDSYTNITGYTLGLVTIPRTSDFTRVFLANSAWRLEEGMVFHMYTWAEGMAFSETMLVTATGAERLTQIDRKLFIS